MASDPNPNLSRRGQRRAQQPKPSLAELHERINAIAHDRLDAIGITSGEPFGQAAEAIAHRIAHGYDAGLPFTFRNPEVSTAPQRGLRDAQAVVVGAVRYKVADTDAPDSRPRGRVAAYARRDFYAALKEPLNAIASELRTGGYRARMVVDDNALVDRAAAVRAGLGWFGKNANVLLPGKGSWFVLGGVITTAPLTPTEAPTYDGCGSCSRCLPACPTNAIPEPGVIDANRCLAWIVQRPGVVPIEFRQAIGTRLYGCDDCQDVCPDNRKADKATELPHAESSDLDHVDLLRALASTDAELLAQFGQWYIPDRDPAHLRRNILIALGNAVTPEFQFEARVALGAALQDPRNLVRQHAVWAAKQWGFDDLVRICEESDSSEAVRAEARSTMHA